MSRKANGVNYGKTVPQKGRRARALSMLETQLLAGTKRQKNKDGGKVVPLTEKDISRINREMDNLKSRL